MSAGIINGREIAAAMKESLCRRVELLSEQGLVPCLAVVIVGDDPASHRYVRNKVIVAGQIGINTLDFKYPADVPEKELLKKICSLNDNQSVNGILVQLPLPDRLNKDSILSSIAPEKDVDGLHPYNLGRLVSDNPLLVPCTPSGILEMLNNSRVVCKGARAVVIGRSVLVGKPMAQLLLREHATVTMCHSRTEDLHNVCRDADILIVAIGKPLMITSEYIKPGAVVIDVGIHSKSGRLVGDVDFDSVIKVAGLISPVPGGVGPMTIMMLMRNTIIALESQHKI